MFKQLFLKSTFKEDIPMDINQDNVKKSCTKRKNTGKISKEEKLKRKRECERRRREKIKSDPEKYRRQQQQEKERYVKRIKEGKLKLINDLTPREQRRKRKQWNENNKRYREKIKQLQNILNTNTPPISDEEAHSEDNQVSEEGNKMPGENDIIHSKAGSSRKEVGSKRVRKAKARAYRLISKQNEEVRKWKKSSEKYRKKYERLKGKQFKKSLADLTPLSKTELLTQGIEVPPAVKRKILFGEALTQQLSQNFSVLKDDHSKQIFTKVIGGNILKKYKLLNLSTEFLPYKYFKSNKLRTPQYLAYERGKKNSVKCLKEEVKAFLESDENSRQCPGKKQCITFKKIKKQKRYLNNTMQELHKKFLRSSKFKISYTTFCRFRPFWTVPPKVDSRDTCLCVSHENIKLIIEKLHRLSVIQEKTINAILESLCCRDDNELCLIRKCNICKDKVITYYKFDGDEACTYQKWITKKETRKNYKTNKDFIVQRTLKEDIHTNKYNLVKELENMIPKFLSHVRNVLHQFRKIRDMKKSLCDRDLFLHIDFSENYSCKYFSEAQSVHFGASRQQITLHTAVLYTKYATQCFCTVSPSLRHDSKAIIAHIIPIIKAYLNEYQGIDTLFFLSDSPNTQYRNKTVFSLVCTYLTKKFPAIKRISWNYSEAGHGKGAPDGVGATLKRTADRLVAQSKDINNFEKFITAVKDCTKKIKIEVVTEQDIKNIDNEVLEDFSTVKGTMQVHNFSWNHLENTIYFNTLTCGICEVGSYCNHFPWTSICLGKTPVQVHEESEPADCRKSEENIKIGEWVVVIYDDNWYPGLVTSQTDELLQVEFMLRSGENFYWPVVSDKQSVPANEILCKLKEPPIPCSSRYFQINECKKIDQLKNKLFNI